MLLGANPFDTRFGPSYEGWITGRDVLTGGYFSDPIIAAPLGRPAASADIAATLAPALRMAQLTTTTALALLALVAYAVLRMQ